VEVHQQDGVAEDRGRMAEQRGDCRLLRPRQRRRLRLEPHRKALRRLSATALGERVRGYGYRPRDRAPGDSPPWWQGMGRGGARSWSDALVHARFPDPFLAELIAPRIAS